MEVRIEDDGTIRIEVDFDPNTMPANHHQLLNGARKFHLHVNDGDTMLMYEYYLELRTDDPPPKTPLEKVRARAKVHQKMYSQFKFDQFMSWVEDHEPSWISWASGQTTARLNKSKRSEESMAGMCKD